MTPNPYASPSEGSSREVAQGADENAASRSGSQLDKVAKTIIGVCGSWFGMMIVGRFLDENAPPIRAMLTFYAMLSVAPALGLYGAVCILKRERYPMAMIGAIAIAMPLIGPWCGLTLPLGVWSLILLRRKSAREAFESRAASVSEIDEDAEDAIARAANLDRIGDWDAAINLFSEVATRWPDYANYSNNCIVAIRRKQTASD